MSTGGPGAKPSARPSGGGLWCIRGGGSQQTRTRPEARWRRLPDAFPIQDRRHAYPILRGGGSQYQPRRGRQQPNGADSQDSSPPNADHPRLRAQILDPHPGRGREFSRYLRGSQQPSTADSQGSSVSHPIEQNPWFLPSPRWRTQ